MREGAEADAAAGGGLGSAGSVESHVRDLEGEVGVGKPSHSVPISSVGMGSRALAARLSQPPQLQQPRALGAARDNAAARMELQQAIRATQQLQRQRQQQVQVAAAGGTLDARSKLEALQAQVRGACAGVLCRVRYNYKSQRVL